MEFGILGPLEVRADGRAVPLGGTKPRAVLAVLALRANQSVSAEGLAVALWGEDAPPSAVKTIQVYVARLRRALDDPDRLVTTPAGYCLRVSPGEVDVERFERHVADGREALAAGRGEAAARELREALELWRGPPLAELASTPFAPAEIARLEEQHLAALEVRVEADLAAGRHSELVGELQQLTSVHPWRERLHAQLMLALYRSGRQADALEAYREARETLVEQLGVEPGAELHDLHEAILAHDPAIDAAPAAAGAAGSLTALRDRRLAAPPNRTIGRAHELATLTERLRSRSVRMLTLTGPGGVGKTRLALEAARAVEPDFRDGAHLVSLAALQRPEDVPVAIMKALGIIALSGEAPEQAVERFLAAKDLLLVADNFEHLLDAAPFIGRLLGACGGVMVLATSRELLSLQAETRLPVSPLALPERRVATDAEQMAGIDAVALFSERARAHDPDFALDDGNADAVAEICRRVDGLPLAVELAAARCGLLAPAEILERLDTALASGARDAPGRQRTLQATIDWSYDLLDAHEQACFARFAAFAGGATLEAAEAITGADLDTLDHLVGKSLLVRHQPGGTSTRLAMLETIRTYAAERLGAAAEDHAARERHCHYYLALAQRHGTYRALWGRDGSRHLAVLDADIDNLQAALAWAVRRGDAGLALMLAAALGPYWLMRDRYADAVAWIDQALSLPGAADHPGLQVHALCSKVWCLWPIGRAEDQTAAAVEAERIARALGDPLVLTTALQTRAEHESDRGGFEVADALADEALSWAKVAGDDFEIASALCTKAVAAPTSAARRERVDRAAARLEDAGSIWKLTDLFGSVAYLALREGNDRDARELVDRAMPLARELDNGYIWMGLLGAFGLARLLTGDADAAHQAFREELTVCRDLVVPPMASEGLLGLASVAVVEGDVDRAARLVGAAATHNYGRPDEDALDARLDTTFLEPARAGHGADAWDTAVREGMALSFEHAMAYALEEPFT